jgi:hypothetical protein
MNYTISSMPHPIVFFPLKLGENYRFIQLNLIKEFNKTTSGKLWILTADFDREFDTNFEEFVLILEKHGMLYLENWEG